MLLSEINGEYQKKRMIVYNADGTKPIVHNIEVAPIFGNIYMSRLEKSDTCSYAACDLYLYLEDHGVGLLVGTAAEDDSLELVEGQVRRYRVGSEGEFLAMIRDRINTGSYISLVYNGKSLRYSQAFFCCLVSKIKFLSVVIVWRQSAA